jgi:hypothetical protein
MARYVTMSELRVPRQRIPSTSTDEAGSSSYRQFGQFILDQHGNIYISGCQSEADWGRMREVLAMPLTGVRPNAAAHASKEGVSQVIFSSQTAADTWVRRQRERRGPIPVAFSVDPEQWLEALPLNCCGTRFTASEVREENGFQSPAEQK